MDAPDETAHPFQRVALIQLGRASAVLGEDAEAESAVAVQRVLVEHERRHHRDFTLRQLTHKHVLFQNRRIRPARGPIKLRHQRRAVFQPHLIDAILITVECQQTAIGAQPEAVYRVEYHIWRQASKSVGVHARIVREQGCHECDTKIHMPALRVSTSLWVDSLYCSGRSGAAEFS